MESHPFSRKTHCNMSEFKQVVSDGAKKVGHSIKKVFFIILALLIFGGGIYLLVCNLRRSTQPGGYKFRSQFGADGKYMGLFGQ